MWELPSPYNINVKVNKRKERSSQSSSSRLYPQNPYNQWINNPKNIITIIQYELGSISCLLYSIRSLEHNSSHAWSYRFK